MVLGTGMQQETDKILALYLFMKRDQVKRSAMKTVMQDEETETHRGMFELFLKGWFRERL